ncbi:MAG: hypothetical protein RJA86_1755, partial [Pseudomonadota bacterium]
WGEFIRPQIQRLKPPLQKCELISNAYLANFS